MAGLVPAIHVLQCIRMAGGYVYFMTNRANGILYVGVTSDLVRRVFEHRSGFVKGFTKQYGLKRLVYFEKFETIQDAIQREHNIKHWPRAWKVRLIVAGNPEWNDLFETMQNKTWMAGTSPAMTSLRNLRFKRERATPGKVSTPTRLTPASIVIKYNYSARDIKKLMGNAGASLEDNSALLDIERQGAVLTVGLNRPAKRNALNDGIILEIGDCFANLPDDIGAVVIHGIGDHFSSGLDLSELADHDATGGLIHSQMWHRVFDRIQYSRVPVVAALKGAVIGGGLELACAAHIRVAEPSAYFALPEGQRGIFVGGGGSVRLPRLIGVARMTDMMLTGRVYSATEGSSYGFAQYLTEAGGALPKALELAERIASNAPLTNFAVLQALPMIAEANPQTGLLMESLMATVAQSDKEAKRRIRAFLDRKTAKVKPA